ncbi:hypothetical protein AVEN_223311-1 [Araneus ventricosus]|uniref:Uncharacterized protein n=1 Tax=Araneus ventricosus TaxID=182803 RepID=A0A4Y2GBL0_ARAVE|nr:hypothetical protein AVEN_223311-1 [Araneus ventricosus]
MRNFHPPSATPKPLPMEEVRTVNQSRFHGNMCLGVPSTKKETSYMMEDFVSISLFSILLLFESTEWILRALLFLSFPFIVLRNRPCYKETTCSVLKNFVFLDDRAFGTWKMVFHNGGLCRIFSAFAEH